MVRWSKRSRTVHPSPESVDADHTSVSKPFRVDNHDPKLSHGGATICGTASALTHDKRFLLESISPVGATEAMEDWLSEVCPNSAFPETHGEASDSRTS